MLPDPVGILAAARRLKGIIAETPLVRSPELSELAGGDVWLKMENEQVTGSFKLRGAYNALASIPEAERARGVVASSAGNHGLGIAYAARALGMPATLYVPSTAPAVKRDGIAALGATLDTSQPDYDAAMDAAKAHAREHGIPFINPCMGEALLAGQGTVALEILAELPEVATIIVPVGGGGLLGGTAGLVRRVAPRVRIVGAQSVETSAMARALDAGRVVEVPVTPTLADGLAGQIDEDGLAIGRAGLDELLPVSEEAIARAIAWLSRAHGAKVEGSGAVGVAALREGLVRDLRPPVVIVVSGSNIDQQKLEALLAKH